MLLGILEVENVDRFLRRLSKETITRSDEIALICSTVADSKQPKARRIDVSTQLR
jgi:hypothetical protein